MATVPLLILHESFDCRRGHSFYYHMGAVQTGCFLFQIIFGKSNTDVPVYRPGFYVSIVRFLI